jgi:hypothetical protein
MRREYFGGLLGLLSDRELTRLLIVGSQAPSAWRRWLLHLDGGRELLEALQRERDSRRARARDPALTIDLRTARTWWPDTERNSLGLAALRANLPRFWSTLTAGAPRYTLLLSNAGARLDRQWLADLLVRTPEVQSVTYVSRRSGAGAWNWPLSLGIPDAAAGDRLYRELDTGRYRGLYKPVRLGREGAEVDVLLYPGSLSDKELGQLSAKADAVFALGNAELDPEAANRRMRTLMQRYQAGLSAVCFVPREERGAWVSTVVRELSHNRDVADALFEARLDDARGGEDGSVIRRELSAPMMLGDPAFLERSTIESFAHRLADGLMYSPYPDSSLSVSEDARRLIGYDRGLASLHELGSDLKARIAALTWDSERGDAARLVRLRAEIEQAVARPVLWSAPSVAGVPERPAASAPTARRATPRPVSFDISASAPAPEPPPAAVPGAKSALEPEAPAAHGTQREERSLQVRLTEAARPPASPPAEVLVPHTTYRAHFLIAAEALEGALVASEPLDERPLDPDAAGHALVLIFCPLSAVRAGDGDPYVPAPTQRSLWLPRTGRSDTAEIFFDSGEQVEHFRARVILTHNNRVLQTLLLHADGDGRPAFDPENRYLPGFSSAPHRPPTDITFVVNDNPAGASGVATLLPDSASFIEPPGLTRLVEHIKARLSETNVSVVGGQQRAPLGQQPALGDENVIALIRDLAKYGVAIVQELRDHNLLGRFDSARRVQVVEAVDSAFLPVEFFYTGPPPKSTAKLCPHAVEALAPGKESVHVACRHRRDREFVCPAGFWAFQKCIERQSSRQDAKHHLAPVDADTQSLGPFAHALLAASVRADAQMAGPQGLPTLAQRPPRQVAHVRTWDEWKRQVENAAPRLMLLMPHSADSAETPGIPALEVSGDLLESIELEFGYVQPEGATGPGPVVFLLGCSTALNELPFLAFARKFATAGAVLVVGTLATVHATQAHRLATLLIREVDADPAAKRSFDEALLAIRRELLAQGDPVALCLTAYGHSAWCL